MWKIKCMSLLAMASSGFLLASGCSFDGWWPWALGAAAAGALGLFGLGT